MNFGRNLFDKMPVRSVVSWTALLSGLLACGEMEEARRVFKRMPVRNVVSWTAMIDGCARTGRPAEAFELFWRMLEENVRPNEFTLVALLIACTELGSLSLGRWVHDFARVNGGLNGGVYVGTALIDMYSNCGSLEDAVKIFDQMPMRSVATWNSMITSLGMHGHGREAIALFKEMEQQNVKPDEITLIGVLCACVRDQMFKKGLRFFRYITRKYALEPHIEHYRCLVELFECSEVESIKHLVLELDAMEQDMLLLACREHSNVELEELIGSCINESDNIGSSVERKVECFQ